MNEQINTANIQEKKEVSTAELIAQLKAWFLFLLKNWKLIIILTVVAAVCGIVYSKLSKTKYQAESTFVLQESKEGPSAKLDLLGLGNKGSSLFESENIIWLYSSRLMLQQTLLTTVDTGGQKVLLLNWFLKESRKDKILAKDPKLGKIKFNTPFSDSVPSISQNAIIGDAIGTIKMEYLKVEDVAKTENIICVKIKSTDELFSKIFTEQLVAHVNSFYIETKVKKVSGEVLVLEQKADSFKKSMNRSMYQVAEEIDATPNANPYLQTLRVAPQRTKVDVEVNSTIYTELVKLLETRRMELAKAAPLIQVIDTPTLPLPISKLGAVKAAIFFGLPVAVVCVLAFSFIWYFKNKM